MFSIPPFSAAKDPAAKHGVERWVRKSNFFSPIALICCIISDETVSIYSLILLISAQKLVVWVKRSV